MMETKYDYVRGFCTVDKVFGLYPVLAVMGENGQYHRTAMACSRLGAERCAGQACRVLAECEKVVDPADEWKLKAKRYVE